MFKLHQKSQYKINDTSGFEKRETEAESIFKEIIPENFPNLGMEPNIQAHEANRTPYLNTKRLLRHIKLKPSKVHDKEFEKQARE